MGLRPLAWPLEVRVWAPEALERGWEGSLVNPPVLSRIRRVVNRQLDHLRLEV